MNHPLRVVLDTNVLISALVFESPGAVWLRTLWQQGGIVPVVSRETAEELMRVLSYKKFALAEADQHDLLEDYLPYAETIAIPKTRAQIPPCRDPKDEIFLRLAYAAKVDAIVTGDDDLLALAGESRISILSPSELAARIKK
jgi:uncharacterized protein